MMMHDRTEYLSKLFCCVATLWLIAACAPTPVPKPHIKPKPQYTAGDYVGNLSQARLNLAENASVLPSSNLDVVKSYNSQRKLKTERQAIMVIDYKLKDSATMQQAIAPISTSAENNNFLGLLDVMNTLDETPNTIHNLHIFGTTITPQKNLKIPSEPDQVRELLDAQQQYILGHAEKLSPLKEVELQLRLIDFFIANRFRDAAYIMADNVKQGLAKATESKTIAPEKLQELSMRLESLEGRMHEKLPYTLGNR